MLHQSHIARGSCAALAVGLAGGAAAQEMIETTYICERGVEIPVVYVNGAAPVAILYAERQLVALPQTDTPVGTRYAAPGKVSGYVWWTSDDEAQLAWFDAELGEQVTLFAFCEEVAGDGD